MSDKRDPDNAWMAHYNASPGREDRHGEMTGAITFNLMIVFLPVTAWCFWVGPWLFDGRALPVMLIGIAMVVGLTIAGLPLSRRLWVIFSRWADRV